MSQKNKRDNKNKEGELRAGSWIRDVVALTSDLRLRVVLQ